MKRFGLFLLAISTLFARYDIQVGDTTWTYDQSTFQAFYMFEQITIDGEDVEETDVLGAFFNGECVGFVYANPTADGGQGTGFTTLPLMGNDGSFPNYMSNGNVPDQVLFYDSSEGSFLEIDISGTNVDFFVDADGDGVDDNPDDDIFGEYPGWANNEIFVLNGVSTVANTFGCTDDSSCNYDSSATADDGSCWYPVDGCDCSNGEGAELDCNGVCNGGSTLDECDVCDDDPSNDCIQDCNGEWGGSAVEDECGNCYSDISDPLWNLACTGCTDPIADNYDSEAIVNDGCEYTVPGVQNLSASSGVGRVNLEWDAPEQMGSSSYTYFILDGDGSQVGSTNYLTFSVQIEWDGQDVDGNGLYDFNSCFSVVASNDYGESDASEEACAAAAIATGCYDWGIQLSAEINGWGQFIESDVYNKLGAGSGTSWSYDDGCDIYEPQHGEGNYISLYFPHEEWDAWGGDNFTQDIVYNDPTFFNHNLTTWDVVVESNMSGETSVNLDFFGEIDGGAPWPVYVLLDGEYTKVEDGDDISFTLYSSEGNAKEFTIIIGNIVPQAPDLTAEDNGDRSVALSWSAAADDLYPADSYHIYRDGYPDHYEDSAETYEFASDHHSEASGCGLFHTDGASVVSIVDNADLYETGEMLLYESTYNYVITARNAAGESSEGHLVRTSGGIETFHAGRYDEDSATTADNIAPVSDIDHLSVSDSDDDDLTADGDYTIPHNHNSDSNSITVSLDGSGSTDSDASYDYAGGDGSGWAFEWSSVTESDNVSNESDLTSDNISFDVINAYGVDSQSETHTYSLKVTSDYPTKSNESSCAAYSVETLSYSDSTTIDVVIHPEPNSSPVAVVENGLDLIIAGDSLSVLTSDDFDVTDGNDFDANHQVWYEPHNNNIDDNTAHLVFSALAASDADGECDAESSGGDCDDLTYDWALTTGDLAGFEYTDLNGNGDFDWGEPYVVSGGDEIYEDADLGDWTATGPAAISVNEDASGYNGIDLDLDLNDDIYILTMTVTDEYGYSDDVSLVVGVHDERNEDPSVGDLRTQSTYYIAYDSDVRSIEIGGCEADDLNADDSDNDDLSYTWEYSYDAAGTSGTALDFIEGSFDSNYEHVNGGSPDNWRSISADLAEGDHTFTFTATDSYDKSASSSTTISVRREPDAASAGVSVAHTDLKYVTLNVNEGSLESLGIDACYGEVYDGDLDNTEKIELYNGAVLIKVWNKDGDLWDDGTAELGTLEWIDKELEAETLYDYSVKSYNSDLSLGLSDDSSEVSATTGNRPTVTILNPNGAEIMSVDDDFDNNNFIVEFSTTDAQYISKIDVFYDDGSQEVQATIDGVSVVDSSGVNVDGIASGNDTDSFEINVKTNVDADNGIGNYGFNYNASVRVEVWDVGNYNGGNVESKDDVSDSPFTMVSDRVEHVFDDGWNMFGSPLVPDNNIMDDAMISLGTFGAEWIVYDVDGAYEDLILNNGEGYYLTLNGDHTMYIDGEALTGDPENGPQASLSLEEGWNLIANPLVNLLDKGELTVSYDGDTKSWDDAVQSGWVAQTINGWFGNSHTPYDQLLPFGGYWVNTSRDVDVHFTSHLLDDGTLARSIDSDLSIITINAVDKAGDAGGDYVVLGVSDQSSDEFSFGEDEYDLPNPNTSSFINLHVNNVDWIGQLDANGNKANNPYFFKDMKSSEFESYQAWNISGEIYSQVETIVELNWDVSNIEYDLHLVMENETIDMKEVNSIEVSSLEVMTVVLGDLDDFNNPLPQEFALGNAYPNPFNPVTQLKLDLAEDGLVNAKVYNVRGQVMAELVNGYMDAGYHMLSWDASSVASGMYMIRVESNGNVATQKVMLLK